MRHSSTRGKDANGNSGSIPTPASGTYAGGHISLNRLVSAQSSQSWSQSFTCDGFGNLTKVTGNNAPGFAQTYDVNNHAGGEDANGNPANIPTPTNGGSASATWDVENRLVAVGAGFASPGTMEYSYAPGNKRIWRGCGFRAMKIIIPG